MHEIRINPEDLASVQRARETEWLLPNGLGGYAMGTALGANTRRYHGLLIAATKPPVGRIVALHSVIEQLVISREDGSEEVIDLSTQMFVGPPPGGEPMLHPGGWRNLRSFRSSAEGCDWEYEVAPGRVSTWGAGNASLTVTESSVDACPPPVAGALNFTKRGAPNVTTIAFCNAGM